MYILILFFSPHVVTQVKKIMNQVFQSLREEFELEESYNGRSILGTIMNTIKVRLALDCFIGMGILLPKYRLRDPA